jgi:hypothetical protein
MKEAKLPLPNIPLFQFSIIPFCITISLRDQSNESVFGEKAFAGSSLSFYPFLHRRGCDQGR